MERPVAANLLADLPGVLPEELVTVITQNQHVRIERIVSTGHATPEGSWYDQDEIEWVLVLKGEARLRFYGDDAPITMRSGDHVLIHAHQKHRVEWTSSEEPTVWLAVFLRE